MALESLPVLDLTDYRRSSTRRQFVEELRQAGRQVGFFHLGGHGVDEELDADVHDMARQFFALPDADRLAIANINSPQFRGYTPLGTEHTNGRPDRRDQLDIGPELAAAPIDPTAPSWHRLRGPNLWPEALPRFRTVFSDWMAQMERVGRTVLQAVAEVLGQPADHFDATLLPRPEARIKVIRYPAQPIGADTAQGVGAHRDSGFLTFIHQDDIGGLQVERDGGFIDVARVPGSYVVNIGEMLQLVAQGFLRATVHRVQSPPAGVERRAIAYFFNPAYEATLAPVVLPDELARLAPGGASLDPHNPILANYGANAMKVRMRSHPDVAARHHADLLDAAP